MELLSATGLFFTGLISHGYNFLRRQLFHMPGSLVRKLEQFTPLSDLEKQIAMRAPVRIRNVGARQDIVPDGSRPTDISLLSEGFACCYKLLSEGRRQITAILVPGDLCDLRALLLGPMDHGVAALSACKVAVIPHQRLSDIIEKHPRLGLALWADTMCDGAISRQWLTNVGRCSAYVRIAHLFCELFTRLQVVGLTNNQSCELPLTQTDIGDAMGLSIVHVNRTLRQLRDDGLVIFRSHSLVLHDWPRLRTAAEFDPSYLVPPRGPLRMREPS